MADLPSPFIAGEVMVALCMCWCGKVERWEVVLAGSDRGADLSKECVLCGLALLCNDRNAPMGVYEAYLKKGRQTRRDTRRRTREEWD